MALHVKMQCHDVDPFPEAPVNHAVRISEDEMLELRQAAQLNRRSIAGQAEHWMRIGRAVERDPKVSYALIETALRSLGPAPLEGLDEAEHGEALMALFNEPPAEQEQAFWRERQQRGVGVGLDEADKLVYAAAKARKKSA